MKIFLFLMLTAIILSCASSYKPIAPSTLRYVNNTTSEDGQLEIGFKYEVLELRGNRKYAKREEKRGIDVVAVRITNNSEREIDFYEDVKIRSNDSEIIPLDPEVVGQSIRQGVAIYLLYGLITIQTYECSFGGCETTAVYPIGVPIAIGNMVVAGSANTNFKNEVKAYSLVDKRILPGQTVYGILGFRELEFGNLSISLKD